MSEPATGDNSMSESKEFTIGTRGITLFIEQKIDQRNVKKSDRHVTDRLNRIPPIGISMSGATCLWPDELAEICRLVKEHLPATGWGEMTDAGWARFSAPRPEEQ